MLRPTLLLAAVFLSPAAAQSRAVADEEVRQVHASALLIDSHNDVTSDTVKGLDIGAARPTGHTDLPRLRKGGVGAVFFSAYVAKTYAVQGTAAHRAIEMIDTVRHDIVARYPKDFQLALTAGDIVAAHKAGRIAALIGLEGGHALEDSPRLLRQFYALGVRYVTLTHTNHNHWADSSGQAGAPNNGLSALGKQIVAEMNRLGMLVDISHVSDKTFWDVLAASKAPPLASHIEQRAGEGLVAQARAQRRHLAERRLGGGHAIPETAQPFAREGDGLRVTIAAEQARLGLGIEQGFRVSAVAERGVEIETGAMDQEPQGLGDQHRLMTRTHGPAPARRRPWRAGRPPTASSAGGCRIPPCGTRPGGSARARTAPRRPHGPGAGRAR